MSKLMYCIKCGEAIEIESLMTNFRSYGGGSLFGSSGYRWDNVSYGVCINDDCERYGIMVSRAKETPPKRKKAKK